MSGDVGLVSYGAYVPRLRLRRKAAASANAWFNPGLMGAAKGERAMANWDEDPITMSVEAGRDCLAGFDRARVDHLALASTTLPFSDRQNAGIAALALELSEDLVTADVTSSQRAGTTALLNSINAVAGGTAEKALVLASDKRKARAASAQELHFGDAGAAFLLGADNVIARLLAAHSVSVDFVDHFRGDGEDYDYNWEERWIRDEGFATIVPRAIKGALEKAGLTGADINHFVMPCTFRGVPQKTAVKCGINPDAVRDNLAATVGEAGAAHALLLLAHILEDAAPGEKILVASFGQGSDALIFEVTDAIKDLAPRRGVSGSLAIRKEETNYMKFLAFNGLVELEKGMRAEKDNKTALSATYRKRDMLTSLVGGKCTKCGTAQFPRSRICVGPNCGEVDSQEPYSFADVPATILSWSADFLTYSMDPPQHYGMITFAEGGRFLADFTDVDPGTVDSGMDVRMVFRIKDFDDKRGFRRYFWKAVPVTG
jgi:3-hydroxy-3-methylglutaryl CoA synthase